MGDQSVVREVFLWSMGCIYLFAFSSLYLQIPGLYGSSGLLPADSMLMTDSSVSSFENFRKQPTLLWFAKDFSLTTETMMEVLCLVGICLSLMVMITRSWRNFSTFFSLWFLYFSLYQVGQTFLWFQWDILLLESGFLCFFVAPFRRTRIQPYSPIHSISLWLVKWLLFRLMFASGVVKLTSRCPTWWGLTALNWHYESQCIPTALAWYAHQLPDWFQKFSVVMTYVIEGPIPFLFLTPMRSLRILAFYLQILFQILIILTGNYNFFNILTMTLCLSLLDDRHLITLFPWLEQEKKDSTCLTTSSWVPRFINILKNFIFFVLLFILFYWTKRLFSLGVNGTDIIHSKVDFTPDQFTNMLSSIVPISIWLGAFSLFVEIVFSFTRCIQQSGILMKMWSFLQWFFIMCTAVWIFSISMVPYTQIDGKSHGNLWPVVRRWHNNVHSYHIVSSYGLFRSMTGVGGRPEVVIEGSDSLDGPWKEYNFLYKPGLVAQNPPFVAPHQPRLDWQMWFAALGSYQHNPWFVHLVYKLLHGEDDVLDLMASKQPFKTPPRYVRAILYKYHYTKYKRNATTLSHVIHNIRLVKSCWVREFTSIYLPPVSKSERTLLQFLNHYNLGLHADSSGRHFTGRLHSIIIYLRSKVRPIDPLSFLASLFTLGVVSNILFNQGFSRPLRIKHHVD